MGEAIELTEKKPTSGNRMLFKRPNVNVVQVEIEMEDECEEIGRSGNTSFDPVFEGLVQNVHFIHSDKNTDQMKQKN